MATSALIVLDDESFGVRLFGLDWLEFVIRRITAEGIGNVVVVVDRVPRTLGDVLDRVRSDALKCAVARSASELADLFHPDERVVLIGGTFVVSAALLSDLVEADGEYLVCASAPAGPASERIDAAAWWTGYASVSGARIGAIANAPGDWNAASMLLRSAVQSGVERRTVATTVVFDPRQPAGAAAFEARAIDRHPCAYEGWGSRLIERAARLLARLASRHLAAAAVIGPALAIVLASAAVALGFVAIGHGAATAAGFVLLACVASRFGSLAATVTGVSIGLSRPTAILVQAAAAAALIAQTVGRGQDATALVLAIMVIATTALCRRGIAVLPSPPTWWIDLPGQAVIVVAATVVAPTMLVAALVAAAVHASVGLWWLQDRVSELLTPRG